MIHILQRNFVVRDYILYNGDKIHKDNYKKN